MNMIIAYKSILLTLTSSVLFIAFTLNQAVAQEDLTITPLERVDEIYLNHKRTSLSDLAFKSLDKIIYGDKRDLDTLQKLLDREVVGPAQEQDLFAMGVALGDVYVQEKQLEWRNYQDQLGKSRAVCLPKSNNCLFPITMISKRVKRDVKVDIDSLYLQGYDLIDDYIPKLPYSADKK